MKTLDQLSEHDVLAQMSEQQPNWFTQWADATDLRDAMDKPEERRQALLEERAAVKVRLVVRACWLECRK